jgi:hypothetical protein
LFRGSKSRGAFFLCFFHSIFLYLPPCTTRTRDPVHLPGSSSFLLFFFSSFLLFFFLFLFITTQNEVTTLSSLFLRSHPPPPITRSFPLFIYCPFSWYRRRKGSSRRNSAHASGVLAQPWWSSEQGLLLAVEAVKRVSQAVSFTAYPSNVRDFCLWGEWHVRWR